MPKCFCCKIEITLANPIIINNEAICNECFAEHYNEIPTIQCIVCGILTSVYHGAGDEDTFICATCLQKDYDQQMDDFLEDPANHPIETAFSEKPKTYYIAEIAIAVAVLALIGLLLLHK